VGGVLLCLLGVALVVSRTSSEQARVDRALATTAGEKAALVDTELERARALALITARIPPFSEFYAAAGSQAARIAAVAGPGREINNALTYLRQLYPGRFVEVGYVDRGGAEDARVVRGRAASVHTLGRDVRWWPSFATGLLTQAGGAAITGPFESPTAHQPVVSAVARVAVHGRVRAWLELELATSALQRAGVRPAGRRLGPDRQPRRRGAGCGWAAVHRLRARAHQPRHLRLAVRRIPQDALAGGPWLVVAGAPRPSALAEAVAPGQGAILALAVALLLAGALGFRRARRLAVEELLRAQAARAEAEQLSRIDVLTGLFNRRHAMETLEHELARTARHWTAVGILMIDVDHFKRINDGRGHAGGDAVLVELGRRLRQGVREWDTVGRVGGEEFCVVAPAVTSESELAALAERLRTAVVERAVTMGGQPPLQVTVSVGAALARADEGSAEHAMECADRALYAAKRRGRNQVCRFSTLDHGDLRAEQPACLTLAETLAGAAELREGVSPSHSREVADLAAAIATRSGSRRARSSARASAAGCTTSARSQRPTASSPSRARSTRPSGASSAPTRRSAPSCSATSPSSPWPATRSATTTSATTAPAIPTG
jgi:diguanylate cyclase (GGDEF)-like protein